MEEISEATSSPTPTASDGNNTRKCDTVIEMDDEMEIEEEVIEDQMDQQQSLSRDDEGGIMSDGEDDNLLAEVEAMERTLNVSVEDVVGAFNVEPEQFDHELEEKRREEVQSFQKLEPNQRIFPDMRSSNFHTVAFNLKPNYKIGDPLEPYPKTFNSKWDPQFVPMPCAREHTRVFKIRQRQDESPTASNLDAGNPTLPIFVEKKVWIWERIEKALMMPMYTSKDITSAIKKYQRSVSQLRVLEYTIDTLMNEGERTHFFATVLPCIQTLALDIGLILTCSLPLLSKFSNYSISLSQKQIAALLASAFFSTLPQRLEKEMEYPSINFIELFQCPEDDTLNSRMITKAHKLLCILNYFTRVAEEMPSGAVTFTRRSIKPLKTPQWSESKKKLTKIVPLLYGTIEDEGAGMLQVDFANKMVGGGVLGGGAVQEEILFVIYPELLISRLFTEKLTCCEALIVTGCERFSRYAGYSRNFRFDGDFHDTICFDAKGRRCSQFVAIDALYITKPVTQFHPRLLARELNKAYTGFSSPSSTCIPVATGKWGCGAFNGNSQLKAILQLMAASEVGRNIVFYTFGDSKIQAEIEEMYAVIKNMTIQQVWNLLNQYNSLFCSTEPKVSLCEFILKYGYNPQHILPIQCPLPVPSPASSNNKYKEIPITNFYTKESKPSTSTSSSTQPTKKQQRDSDRVLIQDESSAIKVNSLNGTSQKQQDKIDDDDDSSPAAKKTNLTDFYEYAKW